MLFVGQSLHHGGIERIGRGGGAAASRNHAPEWPLQFAHCGVTLVDGGGDPGAVAAFDVDRLRQARVRGPDYQFQRCTERRPSNAANRSDWRESSAR